MSVDRKIRPYLFYDTTQSVCTRCLRQVEAKIVFKDDHVYMDKWCPAHGTERVLVSDDVDYYRLCREVYVKPPEMPQRFATAMRHGWPSSRSPTTATCAARPAMPPPAPSGSRIERSRR